VFINQWASHLTKDAFNSFIEKFDNVSLIAGSTSEIGNPLNKKVKVSNIAMHNKKVFLYINGFNT
jgi:hypothetical protein